MVSQRIKVSVHPQPCVGVTHQQSRDEVARAFGHRFWNGINPLFDLHHDEVVGGGLEAVNAGEEVEDEAAQRPQVTSC